jgi:hypothetical protein
MSTSPAKGRYLTVGQSNEGLFLDVGNEIRTYFIN